MIQYDQKNRNGHIPKGYRLDFYQLRNRTASPCAAERNKALCGHAWNEKTYVHQLTKAIGIAKGSFYKFFASKELLFLAFLKKIHA